MLAIFGMEALKDKIRRGTELVPHQLFNVLDEIVAEDTVLETLPMA